MSGLFGIMPEWIAEWFRYAPPGIVSQIEDVNVPEKKHDILLHVAKLNMLGEGGSKKAYSVQEKDDTKYCFTLPNGSAVSNFCLVEYKEPIEWVRDDDADLGGGDPEDKKLAINELRKLYEMSMERNGRTFAPKLEKIKIDDITDPNNRVEGTPFSPENMDTEFAEIESGSTVKISYLIEKCDYNVIEFTLRHPREIGKVCEEIKKFIHSYVDTFNELNTDIKSENLCPTIVDGSVKLIRLSDVDPRFCVQGDTEEFNDNAKVLMTYQLVKHSAKIGYIANENGKEKRLTINFGNFGLTQNDVDNMIRFFYKPEYMNTYYNPIAMLYNYCVYKHPDFFLKLPEGWVFTKSKTTGELYFANEITKQTQWEHPYDDLEKYDFLPYDELIKHFTDVETLIQVFQIMNKESGVVLRPDNPTTVTTASSRAKKASNSRVTKATSSSRAKKIRGGKPSKRTRKARTRKN